VKFRVDRDVLADAVAWAARSLPVRPSVPVLSGLLIEASDDGLVLSTFDYETSARATLAADVSDEGKALVSGRLLSDICRSLPAKPVEMTLDGTRVSLTCGSARFSLQTMPVEDYPTLPDMPAATGTVSSDVFSHAVAQAVTAAGRDDMLPVLTGVRIEISGSSISMLATDRFRLSHRELQWSPHSPDESVAALVPARGDVLPSVGRAARVAAGAMAVLFAFAALWTASVPGVSVRPADVGATTLQSSWGCAKVVLAAAAPVVVLGFLALRRVLPLGARRAGVALGAAGGATGGLALHFICPMATAGHVLLGHVGAMLAASLAGALLLWALLDRR
jgi:hypothetical protein